MYYVRDLLSRQGRVGEVERRPIVGIIEFESEIVVVGDDDSVRLLRVPSDRSVAVPFLSSVEKSMCSTSWP
jgi:hypothetical protein